MAHGLTFFFDKSICIIYIIKYMILSTLYVKKKIRKKSRILGSIFLVISLHKIYIFFADEVHLKYTLKYTTGTFFYNSFLLC